MKFVIALFLGVVALAQAGGDERLQAAEFFLDCMKESGVDPEILRKGLRGDFTEDPKYKQQVLCFNKKAQVMKDDGQFQKDVLGMYLKEIEKDEGKIKQVLDSCAVQKDTPENTSWEMFKCTYKIIPESVKYL